MCRYAYCVHRRWRRIAIVTSICICVAAALVSGVAACRMSRSLALLNSKISSRAEKTNSPEDQSTMSLLDRYRESVCYIYTQYTASSGPDRVKLRDAIGTGFVVANGLIATNRHVVQPWWELEAEQVQSQRSVRFRVTRMIAFFPGMPRAVNLIDAKFSVNSDVAVVHFHSDAAPGPLPLADVHPKPGERVIVLGYPTGVGVMLAKSPSTLRASLTNSARSDNMAGALARNGLLRPLATYGRLGDVSIYRLVYDAHTAQGGSGGPVINSRGHVIGINSAFFDNFCGASIGVPVDDLKRLLDQVSDVELSGNVRRHGTDMSEDTSR